MRISPRQLALAIGVSESSLKRWADAGKLAVSRTDGGHRRIAVSEAVRFIRDSGATVVRPDLLGLGQRAKKPGRPSEALATDARAVRAQLVGRFLSGESVAALADGPIAEAIAQIEALHERDVKSELAARAATDAWTQAIAAVRGLCDVGDGARVAVGGARVTGHGGRATEEGGRGPGEGGRGTGDKATGNRQPATGNRQPATGERMAGLWSAVIAAVLAGEGMRTIDLGAGVTTAVMRAAATAHRSTITWIVDGTTIEVDGYRVHTMAELAAYARGLSRR